MELFTDLKSRLAFRSGGKTEQGPTKGPWERLVGSGQVLVATIDRSGMIREANQTLCELREENREEVEETSLLYLVHAEDRGAFSEMLRAVFGGAPSAAGAGRFLAARDRRPLVHWILLPRPTAEGRVDTVTVLGIPAGADPKADERSAELAELRQMLSDLKRESIGLYKDKAELELKLAESRTEQPPAPAPAAPGPIPGLGEEGATPTLAEVERRYILHVLEQTKGRISGAKGAAALLGLHPNTLRSRMEKHRIGKGA